MQSGTGLEAPIVFLAGLHQLFEKEQSVRLSDEERETLVLENTRKVSMVATCASQQQQLVGVDPPMVCQQD